MASLASASPAWAVINVKTPMSMIYQTSKTVIVGTVAAVDAAAKTINVNVRETVKGESPGERIVVQVVAPDGLMGEVAAGGPVVLFVAKARGGVAVLHLADKWFLANGSPGASPPTWRVLQAHDARQSFPGRTVALVRLLADLKAGKRTILNVIEQNLFPGPARKLAKLDLQKPRWLLAADLTGHKQPDLLVGTDKGTRLLRAAGGGYSDATESWGLSAGPSGYHAVGDVSGDGKPDLLLGNTLWINNGRRFTPIKLPLELPENERPLAAALMDVTGDKLPDVLLLSSNGQLRVLENPGSPGRPWPARPASRLWPEGRAPLAAFFGDWGDTGKPHVMVIGEREITRYALDADGGRPAILERLTGVDLRKDSVKYRDGLKPIKALALDVNGDGRPNLLAICEAGGLLLVNRGFGAYLLDNDAGGGLVAQPDYKPPFRVTPATPWAAADLHGDGLDDVLVLADDGTLYAVDNKLHQPPGGTP